MEGEGGEIGNSRYTLIRNLQWTYPTYLTYLTFPTPYETPRHRRRTPPYVSGVLGYSTDDEKFERRTDEYAVWSCFHAHDDPEDRAT